MKIQTLFDIISILRKGDNVGDVAILKLTLFNDSEGVNRYTDQALALRELNFKPLDMESLERLPKTTFGYAYAYFLKRNRLTPFNFSSQIQKLFERFPVSTRYARVHDMVHTLLGFEADLAGELGVYAFVNEQDYTAFLSKAYRTGRWVTRIMKPWALTEFSAAEERGRKLAHGAKILILEELENLLDQDLDEVRRKLVPAFSTNPPNAARL